MSGALVAQAINESIGTPGFRGIDAILEEYLGRIAEQAGTTRVPISRTINGHPLSSDVNLTNDDVGAAPAGNGYGDKMEYVEVNDEAALEAKLEEMLNGMTAISSKQFILVLSTQTSLNTWAELTYTSSYRGGFAILRVYSWCRYGTGDATNLISMFVKVKRLGTWLPLEYENPPMSLGVEYRTTERFKGKPVYVLAMDLGAMPNNSEKDIYYPNGILVANVVSFDVMLTSVEAGARALPSYASDGSLFGYPHLLNSVIRIKTFRDLSAWNGHAIIKYIKD